MANNGLKSTLKPFKELLGEEVNNSKALVFLSILTNHGEAQVKLASGVIHSIHLGDSGYVDESHIIYTDREGGYQAIFWDQVEALDFHMGYKE